MKSNTQKIIVVDTETIDISKRFIYDIGFIVANKSETGQFESEVEHSFIVKQVFDNKILFHTSYYKKKRPLYTKGLKGRTMKRKHFGHILRFMKVLIKKDKIDRIYAYNSPFDKKGFEYNIDYFGTENIFKGVGWYDILAIANNFIHNTKEYQDFCKLHNHITTKNYYKTNAEITYAFITNNPSYKEIHTGLEDSKIELEILNYCIAKGYDFRHYRKKYHKVVVGHEEVDIQ